MMRNDMGKKSYCRAETQAGQASPRFVNFCVQILFNTYIYGRKKSGEYNKMLFDGIICSVMSTYLFLMHDNIKMFVAINIDI
jgi:hypothetical protein